MIFPDGATVRDSAGGDSGAGWPRSGMRSLALPVGAALVTLLVFLPFARIGVDPHHDGIMLKPAMDVLSGQRLFTDTFSQYGPLATYVQVAFLAVFGKTLFAIKLGTVLMYAAASAFLTAAWRRFLPAPLVVLAYLLWLTLAPFYEPGWALLSWSSVYALTFQSATLYYLLSAAEAEHPGSQAFTCGACAALAFWCRFPVGVFLAVGLVVSFVALARIRRSREWRRPVLWSAIRGGVAIHLGFLGQLVVSGTFGDWFLQNLKWPALWASMHHTDVTSVLPGTGGKLLSGFFVLIYFDTLLRSYPRLSGEVVLSFLWLLVVQLILLLAVLGLVVMLAMALGRAVPWRPGVRWREAMAALRERRPLLACFCGLALFLWLVSPPAAIPWTGSFLRRLSWVYPWEFLVPVSLLVASGVVLVRWPSFVERVDGSYDANRIAGTLCAIVALASWTQYYPIADPRHLYWGVAPGLGAFVFFLQQVGRGRTRLVSVGLALVALPLIVERVGAAREKLSRDARAVGGRSVLAGMRVPPAEAAGWDALLRAIHSAEAGRGNVAMLIEGEDAIYGTLVGDLRNASPYYIDWAGLPRGDDPERRRRFIADRKPLIFVPARNASRVEALVREFHYVVLARIEGTGDILLGPGPIAGRPRG